MHLSKYLRPNGLVPSTEVARRIGIHHQSVRDWASGRAPCPAHFAIPLEELTGGAVCRAELVPAWRKIWPDFVPPVGAEVLGDG